MLSSKSATVIIFVAIAIIAIFCAYVVVGITGTYTFEDNHNDTGNNTTNNDSHVNNTTVKKNNNNNNYNKNKNYNKTHVTPSNHSGNETNFFMPFILNN